MNTFNAFLNSIKKRGMIYSVKILFYEVIFDRIYNIETRADMDDIRSNYMPSSYLLIRELFHSLSLIKNPEDLVLIDFGSGKGRVIAIALRFGFKKIYGIETDKRLLEICKRNLIREDSYRINLENCDATQFRLPLDPSVYYFYNPFALETLEKVLVKIVENDFQEQFIIYLNPIHHSTIINYGFSPIFTLSKSKHVEAYIYERNADSAIR